MPIIVEGILVSRVGTLFRKKSVFPLLSYEIILNIYSTSRLKSNSVTHGLKRLRTTTAFPNVTLTHNVWQRTWFMEDKKKKNLKSILFVLTEAIFLYRPLLIAGTYSRVKSTWIMPCVIPGGVREKGWARLSVWLPGFTLDPVPAARGAAAGAAAKPAC